jgi:RimJ/RimL family protein N-acetyltransferase
MSPELETNRLVLRHWRESDLETWIQMGSDSKVMEFFPATLSRAESLAMAERISDRLITQKFGLWAVEVKSGEPFIGFIGLSHQDVGLPIGSFVEIGWRLKPSSWGNGYATEGARRVLQYGFAECDLEITYSMTSRINIPSRKVMARIGLIEQPQLAFDHPRIAPESALSDHVIYCAEKPIC